MGGRLRFLGHAYSSYTCTGSALDVMDYELAKAKDFSNELTAQTLLILRIIALGLILQRFFHRNTSKLHKHALDTLQHLYISIKVYLRPCAF